MPSVFSVVSMISYKAINFVFLQVIEYECHTYFSDFKSEQLRIFSG